MGAKARRQDFSVNAQTTQQTQRRARPLLYRTFFECTIIDASVHIVYGVALKYALEEYNGALGGVHKKEASWNLSRFQNGHST